MLMRHPSAVIRDNGVASRLQLLDRLKDGIDQLQSYMNFTHMDLGFTDPNVIMDTSDPSLKHPPIFHKDEGIPYDIVLDGCVGGPRTCSCRYSYETVGAIISYEYWELRAHIESDSTAISRIQQANRQLALKYLSKCFSMVDIIPQDKANLGALAGFELEPFAPTELILNLLAWNMRLKADEQMALEYAHDRNTCPVQDLYTAYNSLCRTYFKVIETLNNPTPTLTERSSAYHPVMDLREYISNERARGSWPSNLDDQMWIIRFWKDLGISVNKECFKI